MKQETLPIVFSIPGRMVDLAHETGSELLVAFYPDDPMRCTLVRRIVGGGPPRVTRFEEQTLNGVTWRDCAQPEPV